MVLALGVFSSTIVTLIQSGCSDGFWYKSSGVGCVLFFVGLLLGKKK